MPEETLNDPTAGDGDNTPPAPEAQPGPEPAPDTADEIPAWVREDPIAAYREIQRGRQEAARYRTRARDLEEAEQTRATAELEKNEQWQQLAEQYQQQLSEAQNVAREAVLRQAVTAEALRPQWGPNGDQSFQDADDVLQSRLLENVSIGDDGTVEGLNDALRQLAQTKPYFLAGNQIAPPSGSDRRPSAMAGSGKPPSNTLLDKVAAMQANKMGAHHTFGGGDATISSKTE